MDMDNNIVDQKVWDQGYSNWKLRITEDDMVDYIANILKNEHVNGSLFEVGGYPFRYSAPLCKKFKLVLNCVDKTSAFDINESEAFFDYVGIEYGELINDDFWAVHKNYVQQGKKFNVVCSFGFIEHFNNWRDVLRMHCDLVEDNGFLIITAPNFRGIIQKILHTLFDMPNLKLHVLDAMQPIEWGGIAEEKGFSLIYQGYAGGFEFWGNGAFLGKFRGLLLSVVCKICNKIRKKIKYNHKSYSAYCILVVKKTIRI